MTFVPTVLLTGFEPFGDVKVNPTEKLVNTIKGMLPFSLQDRLMTQVLPVTSEASSIVNGLLEREFDYVIHLGLHINIADFALEKVGLNVDDYRIPDNEGLQIIDQPIDHHGENAYFVSLPVREFERALTEQNIPCHVSYSAGTYLCNHLLYTTLNAISINSIPTKAGFVHVPSLEMMNFEQMLQGTLTILEVLGLNIPA